VSAQAYLPTSSAAKQLEPWQLDPPVAYALVAALAFVELEAEISNKQAADISAVQPPL
jgi:hypothetical protein